MSADESKAAEEPIEDADFLSARVLQLRAQDKARIFSQPITRNGGIAFLLCSEYSPGVPCPRDLTPIPKDRL